METGRKILAGVVGVFILITAIFAARWTGEKIKENFLTPKLAKTATTTTTVTQIPAEQNPNLLAQEPKKTTVTVIPQTGPENFGYYFLSIVFAFGVLLLDKAKNKTYKHNK